VVVVALVVAQLVLPGIAAQRLRDRLSRSGRVLEVTVQAFPAIELLWHQADRVVVHVTNFRATPGHLGSTLAQRIPVPWMRPRRSCTPAGSPSTTRP
jgi:hypothetical protein